MISNQSYNEAYIISCQIPLKYVRFQFFLLYQAAANGGLGSDMPPGPVVRYIDFSSRIVNSRSHIQDVSIILISVRVQSLGLTSCHLHTRRLEVSLWSPAGSARFTERQFGVHELSLA